MKLLLVFIAALLSVAWAKFPYNVRPCQVSGCDTYCILDQQKRSVLWFILQYREEINTEAFDRTAQDYENGFGSFEEGNFWLGLKCQHALSDRHSSELYIEIRDSEDAPMKSYYKEVRLGSPTDGYELSVSGHQGEAVGDVLSKLNEATFSSRGMVSAHAKCAAEQGGGWWYNDHNCGSPNMNSFYNDHKQLTQNKLSTLIASRFKDMGKYISYPRKAIAPSYQDLYKYLSTLRPKPSRYLPPTTSGFVPSVAAKYEDDSQGLNQAFLSLIEPKSEQVVAEANPKTGMILDTLPTVDASDKILQDSVDIYELLYSEIKNNLQQGQVVLPVVVKSDPVPPVKELPKPVQLKQVIDWDFLLDNPWR